MAWIGLLALLCFAHAAGAEDKYLYISPTGSDDNDGSLASPLASIQGAQAAIQKIKAAGPLSQAITVWVAPGYYELASNGSLLFTPQDSGTAEYPITYIGAGSSGSVVLSGGVRVTGWERQGATSLWTATLPSSITPFTQLWADGERQVPARTPLQHFVNSGDYYVQYAPGFISKMPANPQYIRLVTYETWTASVHQVSAIDLGRNLINFTNVFDKQWASASGNRFYLENMAEALDTVGEFYYDRPHGTLTWMAPDGADPNQILMTVPQFVELLTVRGSPASGSMVEFVNFVNLTFWYADADYSACFASACNDQSGNFLTTAAVHVSGARELLLQRVNVGHVGGYGVWLAEGTFNNTLSFSHVYDLGCGGVRLGVGQHGVETRPLYRSEGNAVQDCVIEDGGHVIKEGAGVLAGSVASTAISHNIITNFLYTGVSLGWTWGYAETSMHDNTVSFNAINTIGQHELSDMGGVYTLGKQPGSVVENNIVHSVYSFDYGGWGYYTDEGSTNITYRNNIAFNIKCAGHHQHYGMDNLLTNNVYADVNTAGCDCAVRNSMHAGHTVDCKHIDPAAGEDQGQCSSFLLLSNIASVSAGNTVCSLVTYAYLNCSVDLNVHWDGGQARMQFPTNQKDTSFGAWQGIGRDVHGIVADPQFANGAADDFSSLKPSSPALSRNFHPIDISTVGPRGPVGDISEARIAELRKAALVPSTQPRGLLTSAEQAQYERNFMQRVLAGRRDGSR